MVKARSIKKGLKMVGFHVPAELWKRFRIRTVKDRVTVRAVAAALITAYVEGEFEYEKEKNSPEKG